MIIFFYNPPNKTNLQLLTGNVRAYKDDVRPGHAATLLPIDTYIQGIAFGDNRFSDKVSYGQPRMEAITDAVFDLSKKGQKIDFETFLSEVEKQFRKYKYPIDPEEPHMFLMQ